MNTLGATVCLLYLIGHRSKCGLIHDDCRKCQLNKLADIRFSFSLAVVISASRKAKCSGIEAVIYFFMSRSILSSSSRRSIISRLFILPSADHLHECT